MTVETPTTKVTVNGNGAATSFSFSPIVIFEDTDIEVYLLNTAGVETLLTKDTHYTVVVSSFPGTGSITYPVSGFPLASGESLTIRRLLPIEQTIDVENQGGYFPDVQETALDKLTMICLAQQEELDRTLKLQISSTSQITETDIQNVGTVAGIASEISTVAGVAADVSTVAGATSDISAVNNISADITTVAGIDSDVASVASVAANVTTVAGISAAVSNVAANSTAVTNVSSNTAAIANVSSISSAVSTVAGDSADIQTLAANIGTISTKANTDLSNVPAGYKLPVGIIMDWPIGIAPSGWIFCAGQAISRSVFSELFSLIGLQYGVGNGSTTFNLPDLRGRVIAGLDNMGGAGNANRLSAVLGSGVYGGAGGQATVALSTNELPTHHHLILADVSSNVDITTPVGAQVHMARERDTGGSSSYRSSGTGVNPTMGETTDTGLGQAFGNVQPTIVMAKIIYHGVF